MRGRAETEQALAAIWAEVLNRDHVGCDEDFFALGGNSLLAVRMIGVVCEQLAPQAPPQQLIKCRTVAELAHAIGEGAAPGVQEEGVI